MRVDNRKVKIGVIATYFIFILSAVVLTAIFKILDIFEGDTFFIFLGLAVVLALFYFVTSYFEYDSDGPKVEVMNKGLILSDYINYRERRLEFERSQLVGFKIRHYIIYKTLVLTLKSKRGYLRNVRFNVSLLKSKKLKYVKQSLNKMLKENIKKTQ